MFAGPGSGPLIAAATAWGELAEELLASIASLGSVTSELTSGAWLGPSAAAMMAVATQYLAWLSTAAAQAEQAAAQAMAIATAFEAALAATVQPAVVAANRGLMQLLAATNWFGQNAPALMDVEAAYEQMSALDVAAMAGYHFDASAAVAQLAPWQQVLRNLGIDIGKNGQINLGFGNTGSGNIGNNNIGNNNIGSGNTGTGNIGSGNTGSGNLGLGNLGDGNIGFGNTGSGNIGFGITGDHQMGFGGFNSGSGNIGFQLGHRQRRLIQLRQRKHRHREFGLPEQRHRDLGDNQRGPRQRRQPQHQLLERGDAKRRLRKRGWLGGGLGQLRRLRHRRHEHGGFEFGHPRSALGSTGGLQHGLANVLNSGLTNTPVAAPASAPVGGLDSGNPNPGSGSAAAGSGANPGLRSPGTSYPSFVNSGSNDSGLRNTAVREPSTPGSGIPKSNFYPSPDRESAYASPRIGQPVGSE